QLAQELEAAAKRKDTFATLCSSHTPPLASDPAPLRRFFQTDHKLAAAAYHLVYLDAGVEPRRLPVLPRPGQQGAPTLRRPGPPLGGGGPTRRYSTCSREGCAPPHRRRGTKTSIAP